MSLAASWRARFTVLAAIATMTARPAAVAAVAAVRSVVGFAAAR